MDFQTAALNAKWKAVARDNVDWNSAFGLDKVWRDNAQLWGYPLENKEVTIDLDGNRRSGRTFHLIGFVVWLPSGHKVLGW
jgi:hypothetical protein